MIRSGSIATVPYGWAICDGTQGTPDLRNRFIIGSGIYSVLHEKKDLFIDSSLLEFSGVSALYSPNQLGGSASKTATITVYDTTLTIAQMPAHSHGGSTSIEDNAAIYYDVNSNPSSASRLRLLDY